VHMLAFCQINVLNEYDDDDENVSPMPTYSVAVRLMLCTHYANHVFQFLK